MIVKEILAMFLLLIPIFIKIIEEKFNLFDYYLKILYYVQNIF